MPDKFTLEQDYDGMYWYITRREPVYTYCTITCTLALDEATSAVTEKWFVHHYGPEELPEPPEFHKASDAAQWWMEQVQMPVHDYEVKYRFGRWPEDEGYFQVSRNGEVIGSIWEHQYEKPLMWQAYIEVEEHEDDDNDWGEWPTRMEALKAILEWDIKRKEENTANA